MTTIDEAIDYIRTGNPDAGREILEDILEREEDNSDAWLWLSTVVDSNEDRAVCLENVLTIDPNNEVAQQGVAALEGGSFDLAEFMSEALEARAHLEEVDEDEDEFDFDEDEDLEMPSTMDEEGKSSGLNMRMIILGVLVVGIMGCLAAAAAYNLLLSPPPPAGNGSPNGAPAQESPEPAGSPEEEDAEPTATPAGPTATPTITPTPTETPFVLPTSEPTDAPTETPTRVVPPTPFGG